MGSHAMSMSASAIPVVVWPNPRSAQWPAREAAKAPAIPARPKRPTSVCDMEKGGALSGRTSGVSRVVTFAKISMAITPRVRSTGSSQISLKVEPTRRG
ncbi:hypothetical protein D9M70_464010 [compost metagenome]